MSNFGPLACKLGEHYIQNLYPMFTYNIPGTSSLIFIGFWGIEFWANMRPRPISETLCPHSWVLEHESNTVNKHILFSFQTTPSLLEDGGMTPWTELKLLARIPPPQYWIAWRIWATSQLISMVLWEQHLVCIEELSQNIIFEKCGNSYFNF